VSAVQSGHSERGGGAGRGGEMRENVWRHRYPGQQRLGNQLNSHA